MSICADKDWSMDLVKDGSPDPETFSFTDVRVDNGIVTGKVYARNNVTDLRGTCSSFGYLAHLTFFFRAVTANGGYVDIILFGVGLELPGRQPVFSGRFAALAPVFQAQSEVRVNFDPGDTGTGSGMQAQ